MSNHIILFLDKKGKEVDRFYLNGPVWGAWQFQVINDFKKNEKEIYKSILKFDKNITSSINTLKFVKRILSPIVTYVKEENIFYLTTGEKYKKYGAVTYIYSKASGWAMEDGEEDVKDTFDTKKKYDYVIYGYDNGGEFDKDSPLYLKILAFIKAAIGVKEMDKKIMKQGMIENIIEKGLPVGYSRSEADGGWIVIVNKDQSLILGGYAEEYLEVNKLKDLSISELGNLIDNGKQGDELKKIKEELE